VHHPPLASGPEGVWEAEIAHPPVVRQLYLASERITLRELLTHRRRGGDTLTKSAASTTPAHVRWHEAAEKEVNVIVICHLPHSLRRPDHAVKKSTISAFTLLAAVLLIPWPPPRKVTSLALGMAATTLAAPS
jgi:hypothetical protein